MTTEYYQIPSQQGLLPLLDTSSPDPWLASATSSLSLSLSDNTWSVKKSSSSSLSNPPSLFDSNDVDALSWKNVVPMQNAGMMMKGGVKALPPKVPRQFNSATSKIDAWSVVDDNNSITLDTVKQHKRTSSTNSNISTDTEDKQIEDELSSQNRYKTELCKSFNETGVCRYGTKCQFAHGKEEVRPILRHPKYKTEICKTFHTTGTCPYGTRCRFIHTKTKEESLMTMVKPSLSSSSSVEFEEEDIDDGSVVSLNPPPGIPLPKWSKSWNMAIGSSPVMQRKNNNRVANRLSQPTF